MSAPKTTVTEASVEAFIAGVEDETQRTDSQALVRMMQDITGEAAKMWGPSIVGFGSYHYTYASGREGDWMLCGFSPRKGKLSVYVMQDLEKQSRLLNKLGKHSTGKSCIYIRRLSDVDQQVLRELIEAGVKSLRKKYG